MNTMKFSKALVENDSIQRKVIENVNALAPNGIFPNSSNIALNMIANLSEQFWSGATKRIKTAVPSCHG